MRLVPKVLGQSLAILALSAALAFGVNAIRPDGLPLSPAQAAPAQSAVQLSPSGGEIALKDAVLLFLSGRAVFLDARSQFEFELGHIQGAINLPPREFAAQFQDIKPRLAGKEAVIAYCDGEACPLSQALATHLRGAGLKNVFVLKNGWSLWLAERLPTAAGPAASSATGQAAPKAAQTPAAAPAKPGKAPAKAGTPGKAGLCTDCTN